ncbi:MAG: nickel-responsive transcriptional regulator NikR [Nevskia sp.]
MRRVTLSLDDHLADQFDAWAERHGYENRSEAFRDLLRGRLENERIDSGKATHCVATVTYVYNHHERQLASRLAESQHDHHGLSMATLHVHLDHDNCLETMALKGPLDKVRAFGESLIAERGVRHGHLHLVPVALEISKIAGQPHVHVSPIS